MSTDQLPRKNPWKAAKAKNRFPQTESDGPKRLFDFVPRLGAFIAPLSARYSTSELRCSRRCNSGERRQKKARWFDF